VYDGIPGYSTFEYKSNILAVGIFARISRTAFRPGMDVPTDEHVV
jgi:hypothetical protein